MTMNSKIPGISLIQDTSEWFSVVERTQKEHPAVSFSQIMMRAGITAEIAKFISMARFTTHA
jgi:hypothetical protein